MAIAGNPVVGMAPDAQRLASFPSVPQRKYSGDGIEPTDEKGGPNAREPQEPDAQGQPQGPTLQTVTDDAVRFKTLDGLSRSQDRLAKNRWAIDQYYAAVRNNVLFATLDKIPNQAIWVFKLPMGMQAERGASTPNKADDLCNKVESALLADPPEPNFRAVVNDESARAAARLGSEFLTQVRGENGINEILHYRWALNTALTRGSAFLEFDVDEDGGGWQPYQVLAHPQATDPKNPLVAMVPAPQAPQPPPLPGQPPQPPPPPQMVQAPAVDPELRYVSAQGQFVQTAAEADRVWVPAIVVRRYRREQVRLFPITATIEEAVGTLVIGYCTLAEGRTRWKSVAAMSSAQLSQLASWRPGAYDRTVPFAMRGGVADGMTGPSLDDVGSFSPLLQRRMFYYRLYVKPGREYEQGFDLTMSGANGGITLDEQTMDYQVTLPKGGPTSRCRDLPLVQITPCQDADGGDPMGFPFISRFAGASDAEMMIYASYQDAINQRLHPHVFLRSNTAVDDQDWQDRSVPVILNPADQEPTYENFSPMPDPLPMIQNMDTKMDTSSDLTATAQGLDSENAQSGVAKQLTIRQAQIGLSGIQHQLHGGMSRGRRIMLQLAQAKFSVPQLMEYTGEDGTAEAEWWTGENLAGLDDRLGVEPGTGTMMTSEGKAQLAAFMQQQQWLTPAQAAEVGMSGVGKNLGLAQDPVKQAIERAVGVWLKGPPEQWHPGGPTSQVNPQTNQPVVQPPSFTPFTPRPNDTEPAVAQAWAARLSQVMMEPEYENFDPKWSALLGTRYQQAIQAVQQANQPPKTQADATYAAFVTDVTQQAMKRASAFVAQEVLALGPPDPTMQLVKPTDPNAHLVPPKPAAHAGHKPPAPPIKLPGGPQSA